MKFYMTRLLEEGEPRSTARGIVALDEETGYIYRWVANTRAWHRRRRDEANFYAPDITDDRQVEYTPVTAREAAAALEDVAKLDRRYDAQRELLEQYRAQLNTAGEVLTSAEVGLTSTQEPGYFTTSEELRQLLQTRSKRRQWTELRRYRRGETSDSAPREGKANVLKSARLASPRPGWEIEAEITEASGGAAAKGASTRQADQVLRARYRKTAPKKTPDKAKPRT